ncbi:RNA-binding protein [Ectothiorhodospira marina]|uniref:RNA-binding protein n=2 Tax=Ectothiorhodospira marina TaxID=1396821 RepID=A0A1H7F5P3_9GAMM|nr:RNA-binding protein [Ectothiorhodospira marina]
MTVQDTLTRYASGDSYLRVEVRALKLRGLFILVGTLLATMPTPQQIKHLRALAHDKKPVVSLGRHGLTDAVLEELDIALNHHELIKVKVGVGDRELRDQVVTQMCERSGAALVQRIGNIAILFRRNPEKPVVKLP